MGCGPSTPDGKPIVVPAHEPPGVDAGRHANGVPNGSVPSAMKRHTANQNGRGGVSGGFEEISSYKTAPAMNGHKPPSPPKKKGNSYLL